MGKRKKKKQTQSGKKKQVKPVIPPKQDDKPDNQDRPDTGGMDFSNFRKNLGCG